MNAEQLAEVAELIVVRYKHALTLNRTSRYAIRNEMRTIWLMMDIVGYSYRSKFQRCLRTLIHTL